MPRESLQTCIRRFALAATAAGALSAIAVSASMAPTEGAGGGTVAATGPKMAQATERPADVNILEPPLKPPTTWAYEPRVLTVKIGTTVTWTNTGAVVHTVTAADRKTFDSKEIRPKARFSWTFPSAGTFAYICTYHPWMKGTIVVEP
jgi:plastocyanin